MADHTTKGPFINAALLCDQVVEGKDGALTLVRVIDRFAVSAAGPDAPETMPPQQFRAALVITLKSGAALGRFGVTIQLESPDGTVGDPLSADINFEGADRGVNLVFGVDIQITLEGLYWFNITNGDALLTRIPLRVQYARTLMS